MTRIVVVGGTGLIGAKTVARLAARGHEVTAAASRSGVNTLTGEGLAAALEGAEVVVDTTRPPSTSTGVEVFAFFTRSTANLLAAGVAAGVRHHVALTIVGTDADVSVPYYTAKRAQEELVRDGGIPFSLVHATQFFEFVKSIADAATVGDTVRLAPVRIEPMAAEDVATAVARATVGRPLNGIVEVAGPEQFQLDELIRLGLRARNDARTVIADPDATYFGARLSENELVPGKFATHYDTRFEEWLALEPVR